MTYQNACETDADEAEAARAAMLARVDARREDTFWRHACALENYFCSDLDYEDYAPAYCVGYIGFAQYGGSFEDAQNCLWANWQRIKGDSRLPTPDAGLAMRAAWSRMESLRDTEAAEEATPLVAPAPRTRTGAPVYEVA